MGSRCRPWAWTRAWALAEFQARAEEGAAAAGGYPSTERCRCSLRGMEGTAVAVFEILRFLIIHWKCDIDVSKGALLEGQLVISIEGLNSKHQANALHCVTTNVVSLCYPGRSAVAQSQLTATSTSQVQAILVPQSPRVAGITGAHHHAWLIMVASAGSLFGGMVLKKFLKEIQSILPGISAKLTWTSEEGSYSQDMTGVTPFQMIFEVDEKPRTLMTDCLVIKHFLRKIIMVHPKVRFHFSVKVNGILSTEIFGVENEPTLNLGNGIALVVDSQHYVSGPNFGTIESHCSRIHPVLGHPVMLFIPEDVAGMDLLGELILTPAAALCPSPKISSNKLNRISSVSIFLYGPLGLPLILSTWEQPMTTFFKDTSSLIDWKKYHLCMIPNLDLNLDRDLVLPDVSYQVESSEGDQSQNMDPQGQTLLLFLFVDFHSAFPVQQMEIWGVYTLLTTHLNAILVDSHSVVQSSIQFTVDKVLEQHHQAAKAQQKLQASLSVAVNSIMSILTGSTRSSFRKMCLQTLQAADTQEFGTKLHKVFREITQHQFLHHCSCEVKQLTLEKKDSAQGTEDAPDNSSLELLADTSGQAENKRLKRGSLRMEEMPALRSARAPSPSEATPRRPEATAAPLTSSGREAREAHGRALAPDRASLGSRLEDVLWLQEVSKLSEWLSPSPGP
ncbi:type 2 DNA topoisomerase 6 subunit B-like isoform X2 [Symphalangus syndactylus]|uniref:type 2 DNA topoisomerase 6 subunit B-like isoform X2 n=1 Tax=Symphalangus syndactylus TaxID=9590 RepID=UPI0024429B42|nr:type 2 DNA topoisomerase 6 subunit B-like isoform X2 [Symphalangus syndactylus]